MRPINQLYSLGEAYLSGPLDAQHLADVVANMCKPPPNTKEINHTLSSSFGQGDEYAANHDLPRAMQEYQFGLAVLRASPCTWQADDSIVLDGLCKGLTHYEYVSIISTRRLATLLIR